MAWYVFVAHFFGGAFLANTVPHLVAGIAGQPLQTPFASPPFRGVSSSHVNVAWALANLAFAYLLLAQVGPLDFRKLSDVSITFLGFAAMAFECSRAFARLRRSPAT